MVAGLVTRSCRSISDIAAFRERSPLGLARSSRGDPASRMISGAGTSPLTSPGVTASRSLRTPAKRPEERPGQRQMPFRSREFVCGQVAGERSVGSALA
jgi:hypothetical protein